MDVFVRVRRRETHGFQRIGDAALALGSGRGIAAEQVEGLGHQPVDAVARIEGTVGVLEHHLHLATGLERGAGGSDQGFPIENDRPALQRVERHDGAGQRRLAGAGLADEADILAALDAEADVVHGAERAGGTKRRTSRQLVVADDVFGVEHRGCPRLWLGRFMALGHMARGGKQRLGVGMAQLAEDRAGLAGFHHLALPHDGDAVGDAGDHRQVMGDKDHAHAVLADEALEQHQDLRLRGDVEGRGRFVGDEQLRPQGDGHGDNDALALAAREFVRVAAEGELFGRKTDAVEGLAGDMGGAVAADLGVGENGLGDLVANGLERIEGRHRLLKDHADILAADPAHFALGSGQQVVALEGDAAACRRALWQELHHRERRHRLAGARLADDPQDLALVHRKVDAPENGRAADREPQILDLEQGHWRLRLRRGSKMSRSPSPMRLSPNTVSTIARPGMMATWGASEISVCASASILPQLGIGGWAPRPT